MIRNREWHPRHTPAVHDLAVNMQVKPTLGGYTVDVVGSIPAGPTTSTAVTQYASIGCSPGPAT